MDQTLQTRLIADRKRRRERDVHGEHETGDGVEGGFGMDALTKRRRLTNDSIFKEQGVSEQHQESSSPSLHKSKERSSSFSPLTSFSTLSLTHSPPTTDTTARGPRTSTPYHVRSRQPLHRSLSWCWAESWEEETAAAETPSRPQKGVGARTQGDEDVFFSDSDDEVNRSLAVRYPPPTPSSGSLPMTNSLPSSPFESARMERDDPFTTPSFSRPISTPRSVFHRAGGYPLPDLTFSSTSSAPTGLCTPVSDPALGGSTPAPVETPTRLGVGVRFALPRPRTPRSLPRPHGLNDTTNDQAFLKSDLPTGHPLEPLKTYTSR